MLKEAICKVAMQFRSKQEFYFEVPAPSTSLAVFGPGRVNVMNYVMGRVDYWLHRVFLNTIFSFHLCTSSVLGSSVVNPNRRASEKSFLNGFEMFKMFLHIFKES